MNKTTFLFLFSALIIFFTSCSKDQKTIRRLFGEWKITNMKLDYVTKKCGAFQKDSVHFDFNNIGKMNFERNRLEGNYRSGTSYTIIPEFKVGTVTFKQDTDNARFTWFVDQIQGTDDQKIGMRDDTTNIYRQCIIEEISKDKLKYRYVLTNNCTKQYYYLSLEK